MPLDIHTLLEHRKEPQFARNVPQIRGRKGHTALHPKASQDIEDKPRQNLDVPVQLVKKKTEVGAAFVLTKRT